MQENTPLERSKIFDDFLNNNYISIIIVDKYRKCVLVNDSFCKLFGYEKTELIGKNAELFHMSKDNYIKFGEITYNEILKVKAISIDYEFIKKDGSTFWGRISGNLVQDNEYILWSLIDITDKVLTRKKLEFAKERLNLALEGSSVGIWDWNFKTNTIYFSTTWKKMLGYEDSELKNEHTTFELLVEEKRLEQFYEHLEKYLKDEINSFSMFIEMKHKNGDLVPIQVRAKKVLDENGIVVRVVGTHTNLTEINKIQGQLSEQKALLQAVIDEIPYPIVLKDYDGKFVLVNEFTANLYESTCKEMIGKDDADFLEDKQKTDIFKENIRKIIDTGKTQVVYEDAINTKTNEIINFMSIKKPFINRKGEKLVLILANDITELNKKNAEISQKERMIFQQSKLASMGEMLANIAHQWRQPLSSISTMATGMSLEKEFGILGDDRLKEGLKNINTSTQYLSQTIDDFRNFYNPKNSFLKVIDIENIIEKVLNILKGQFSSSNIKIHKKIENVKINTLENELIQVLINILNNAKDALKQIKKEKIILIKIFEKRNILFIEIFDNAKGVEKKILNKIFEPYFTTKHQSMGTGIGLYMCKEIVLKHLFGEITATNSKFKICDDEFFGAKFQIKLPINKNK